MILIQAIFWFLRLSINAVSPSISANIINHFSAPPRGGRLLGRGVAALYNNDLESGDIFSPAQYSFSISQYLRHYHKLFFHTASRKGPLGAVVAALYNDDRDSGDILFSPAQY